MTLLLALLTTFGAWAQTTVTIGDGTSASYYNPLSTYYNYSITEQLYTADEIGIAGSISSISFNYVYNTANKEYEIKVYMANVDAADLSTGISLADADEVFSGTIYITETGWVTIDLDTPFAYDGTSNLLIGINKTSGSSWFSGNTWQYTTTETHMARYTQNDSNPYTISTVPGTVTSNRPNIQIVITPGSGPVCNKPETLEASNVTSNSAVLTWTGGSGTYNVEYKLASAEDWNSLLANTTSTSYTLTGLAPGKAYQARVQSVCGEDVSGWKSVSFSTLFGIPLIEEFGTSIPAGWAQYTGLLESVMAGTAELTSATYGWNFGTGNDVFDNHARVNIYGTSCNKWLVLPTLAMEDNVQLSFEVAYTAYSGSDAPAQTGTDDKFVVLINDGQGWTVLRQWDNAGSEYVLNNLNTTPIIVTLDLSSYKGKNVSIAFYGESTESNADNNLHIDNVSIDYIPACPKPTGLTVNYTGGTTAEVSWTSDADAWQLGLIGADGQTIEYIYSVATNPYTLTGLALGTTYRLAVRALCGGGSESEWTSPVSFTTDLCMPEDMCNITFELTDSYGDGWNGAYIEVLDVATGTSLGQLSNRNVAKASESEEAEGTKAGGAKAAETETYTLAVCDGRDIQFVWHSGSYDNECSYAVYDVNGDEIFSGSGTMSEYVDYTMNCTVSSCRKPTDLAASEIGPHSAKLSWTENGDATAWVVAYSTDGTNFTNVDASTNPFTLTNLSAETAYTVKVRPLCDDFDDKWSDEMTFTTLVAAPAPTNLMVSNIETTSATVSWTSSSNNNQLRYVAYPNYVFQGYVTNPGAMADGADASWLQGEQGTWGPGVQKAQGNMLADDFTIYTATSLSEIEVYGYQTGSTTTSTFTGLYAQIYDGNPADGGTAIWGDMDTNIMTGTSFTNCYRGSNGETNAITRPIMAITASGLDIELVPGTYWLVYSLEGTGSSGPWGVPNAEPTIGSTGEGLQYASSSWTNLTDSNSGTSYGCAMKLTFEDIETFDWTYVNNIEDGECNLTNLSPDTPYLVQIRSNYGDDGDSQWVSKFFTTPSACDAPIDLAANDVTADAATLSWTGYQDSYTVRYRTAENSQPSEGSFFDDFESGNLEGWTILREGEGTDYTDWRVVNSEDLFTIAAHSGTNVVMGRSWNSDAYSVDNWLITPQVSLNGTLSYWVRDDGEYHEHYDVYVSTTTNDPTAFTLLYEPGDASETWTQHTVDLTSFAGQQGYIAFRLVDEDKDYLFIDDVLIGTIIITPAGEWTTKSATSETLDLTGLTPDTEYEWQVQGVNAGCDGGVTAWSGTSTFTTWGVENILFAKDGYATYYNGIRDVVLPEGMKAHVVTDGSTTLTYNKVADGDTDGNVVPAGTAVLLQVEKAAADHSVSIYLTRPNVAAYTGTNLLYGSDEDNTETFGGAPYYKLTYSNNNDNFGWYYGATNGGVFESPAHKAWLALGSSGAPSFLGLPDWDTTGIVPVSVNPEDGEWYTLQGMKVGKKPTTTGVYIHNGRKVLIP